MMENLQFNVISAEFYHESNTFNKKKSDISSFKGRYYYEGNDAIVARCVDGSNTELLGFHEVAIQKEWNMTHILSTSAEPGGIVTSDVFELVANKIINGIRSFQITATVHGLLLGLHGSMVTEDSEDGEGELLSRIRCAIGHDIPIAITLDLHANCTRKMCELSNIAVSFKTYPHTDMRETGNHAAKLLHRTMNKEINPKILRVHIPMLEEANSGRTDQGAMIERVKSMIEYENSQAGALAVSINAGFGNADIQEVGPTVLVTYDISVDVDESVHMSFAKVLANDVWEKRHDVINTYLSVEAAALIAKNHINSKPLVIADYSDNPGGGAYADGTNLLKALIDAGVENCCFGPLYDPAAARLLIDVSESLPDGCKDSLIKTTIGGKSDPRFGGLPIDVEGRIMLTSDDGAYTGDGPMIYGLHLYYGPTAVLRINDQIDVLIVSEPAQMLDLQQFIAFGIIPHEKNVIALKGMQHFRAAFEPIASSVIVVDSGALCTPDLSKLPYGAVKRPIFPLDDVRDVVFDEVPVDLDSFFSSALSVDKLSVNDDFGCNDLNIDDMRKAASWRLSGCISAADISRSEDDDEGDGANTNMGFETIDTWDSSTEDLEYEEDVPSIIVRSASLWGIGTNVGSGSSSNQPSAFMPWSRQEEHVCSKSHSVIVSMDLNNISQCVCTSLCLSLHLNDSNSSWVAIGNLKNVCVNGVTYYPHKEAYFACTNGTIFADYAHKWPLQSQQLGRLTRRYFQLNDSSISYWASRSDSSHQSPMHTFQLTSSSKAYKSTYFFLPCVKIESDSDVMYIRCTGRYSSSRWIEMLGRVISSLKQTPLHTDKPTYRIRYYLNDETSTMHACTDVKSTSNSKHMYHVSLFHEMNEYDTNADSYNHYINVGTTESTVSSNMYQLFCSRLITGRLNCIRFVHNRIVVAGAHGLVGLLDSEAKSLDVHHSNSSTSDKTILKNAYFISNTNYDLMSAGVSSHSVSSVVTLLVASTTNYFATGCDAGLLCLWKLHNDGMHMQSRIDLSMLADSLSSNSDGSIIECVKFVQFVDHDTYMIVGTNMRLLLLSINATTDTVDKWVTLDETSNSNKGIFAAVFEHVDDNIGSDTTTSGNYKLMEWALEDSASSNNKCKLTRVEWSSKKVKEYISKMVTV